MTIIYILLALIGLLSIMYGKAFYDNKAPMTSPPGFLTRFIFYMGTNIAETSDNPKMPEMKTPEFSESSEDVFSATKKALPELGWTIETIDETNKEIKAIVTSKLFKFKDDIKVKIQTNTSGKTTFYAYSKSRVGLGDMGANQLHITLLVERIRHLLK